MLVGRMISVPPSTTSLLIFNLDLIQSMQTQLGVLGNCLFTEVLSNDALSLVVLDLFINDLFTELFKSFEFERA